MVIEPHYLPSLEFFCAAIPYGEIRLERHAHYVKQGFRNRTLINTANGVQMLSVPLSVKGNKTALGEVIIDNTSMWSRNHWRALEAAYRNAPFYEHYETGLRAVLQSGTDRLFDLNRNILSFCLASLGWKKNITESFSYEQNPLATDFRDVIRSKEPFTARNHYQPYPYYQVFGNEFVANMSVIDLIFCCGPSAAEILLKSAKGVPG